MKPTTFRAELGDTVVQAKARGATTRDAAREAGVPRQTLYDWLRFGEIDGREPYRSFATAFRNAEGVPAAALEAEFRLKIASLREAYLRAELNQQVDEHVITPQEADALLRLRLP